MVGLLACTRSGDVGVYLDNFTFPLTLCHTSFECRTGCLLFVLLLSRVSIVNFLSHHEESGLQYIIGLALHVANLRYTTLFTSGFDLRRHVTLGDKSPEPVSFVTEATLGMIIVPTTGVFPVKVFYTKCTEEEFVIGQVLRCSGSENRDMTLSWRGGRG